MKSARIDLRFAPIVALLSGLFGGVLVMVARHGWQFVWPIVGVSAVLGFASLVVIGRHRDGEPLYLATTIATTLAVVGFAGAVWGIVSGVGL
jgi:hypothetical protein